MISVVCDSGVVGVDRGVGEVSGWAVGVLVEVGVELETVGASLDSGAGSVGPQAANNPIHAASATELRMTGAISRVIECHYKYCVKVWQL
jgi:hypothetical protein